MGCPLRASVLPVALAVTARLRRPALSTRVDDPRKETAMNDTDVTTPDWTCNIRDFDALEIAPCRVVGHDRFGNEIVEPCDDAPEEATFWAVYGHFRTGGVDAFEDFATEAEALAFHDRLISAHPHLAGGEG